MSVSAPRRCLKTIEALGLGPTTERQPLDADVLGGFRPRRYGTTPGDFGANVQRGLSAAERILPYGGVRSPRPRCSIPS